MNEEEKVLKNKNFVAVAQKTTSEVLANAQKQKDYKTNALFENLFSSVFHSMPLDHLEKYRALMNKIIAERKKTNRIITSNKIKAGNLDGRKIK